MTWKIGWQSANTEEERKKNKMGFGENQTPNQCMHHISREETLRRS
jgi:hypothetical protein